MTAVLRSGRAGALLRACHPEPTAAVTLVATALAVTTGRGLPGTLGVAAAVLAGQLSVGWCNDWADAARDMTTARPDKPLATGLLVRGTVGTAAVVALLACVPLSLASGALAGSLHLAAVASAWSYDLVLKRTALSVLPFAVSFTLLPAYIVLGLPGAPAPPWWLLVAGALLGSGAHFANVLPDLGDDAATGVRGLPHRLGPGGATAASALLLLAASVVLAVGPPGRTRLSGDVAVLAAAGALVAGWVLGRRAGSRAPFRAVLVVALVDVALVVLAGHALGLPG